jgi:teichoic acid transport system permease protein
MHDVHVPPGNIAYLQSLLDRSDYMTYSALNELRSRQMTSVLGNLWHLLNPLLQIGVYFVVFGLVLQVDRGDNYLAFLSIGIFVFGFTQRSTISGAGSIQNNKGLLNAFSFPRALLPVTSTLTEMFATLAPVFVIYIVALLSGAVPTWSWLALVPLMALQLVFNFGAALMAARATNSVRDISQLLPFIFRLLLYMSGVLFDVTQYTEGKSWAWVFDINPIYCIVTLTRWSVLGGEFRLDLFVTFVIWSVVMAAAGLMWFRSGEGDYGRD